MQKTEERWRDGGWKKEDGRSLRENHVLSAKNARGESSDVKREETRFEPRRGRKGRKEKAGEKEKEKEKKRERERERERKGQREKRRDERRP